MPTFSQRSITRLSTCHPDLQRLFHRVIQIYDCVVLEGHRNQEAQDRAFRDGKSKLPWPKGKHNSLPSLAVDVAPYDCAQRPVNWSNDRANIVRFYHFAGVVKGLAESMDIRIRYGGDWDGDTRFDDQTFNDLVHFELLLN